MMSVKKEVDMKELLEQENYGIMVDTNVLLNIYRYCPDFSEFAMECLKVVKDSIYIPGTVRYEYGKHCDADFNAMKKQLEYAQKNLIKQLANYKDKMLNVAKELEKMQYHDIDKLCSEIEEGFENIKTKQEEFFDKRKSVDNAARSWKKDHLKELVAEINAGGRVLPELSMDQIFRWGKIGNERFKNEIPPGYKDSKKKDGVSQYSDFFIWMEMQEFAKSNSKDIVFVCDDVKGDWREVKDGQKVIRDELFAEFDKTGRKLIVLTSEEFYREISEAYAIERNDTVSLALNMTDSEYGSKVSEYVFDNIINDLTYNGMDYIVCDPMEIGSEGIDSFDIVSHQLKQVERVDRVDDSFMYEFTYEVKMEGISYDYWGRDDDTKEIITSPGTMHEIEGDITVIVERHADIFLDVNSADFESAEIVDGMLEITNSYELLEDDVY